MRALAVAGAVLLVGRLAPRAGGWIAAVFAVPAVVVSAFAVWVGAILRERLGATEKPTNALVGVAAIVAGSAFAAWISWRRPSRGFTTRRGWLAVAVLVLASAAVVVWFAPWKTHEPENATGPDRLFREDGMVFRYPASWKLEIGDWQPQEGSRGAYRRLELHREGSETVTMTEFRPPMEVDLERALSKMRFTGALGGGHAGGPPTAVDVSIGGRRVQGLQQNLVMRQVTITRPWRVQMYSIDTSRRTVVFLVQSAESDWKDAEPRVRAFLEHFQAD